MPMFLWQATFRPEAFKSLINNPQDRTEAARRVVEAAGGKLHHYFFAFGDHDLVLLMEFPDLASCASSVMAVAAGGAIATARTTVLMTAAEAKEAMTRAGTVSQAYAPPKA
jgi:uncharacterized protein with GYD domain